MPTISYICYQIYEEASLPFYMSVNTYHVSTHSPIIISINQSAAIHLFVFLWHLWTLYGSSATAISYNMNDIFWSQRPAKYRKRVRNITIQKTLLTIQKTLLTTDTEHVIKRHARKIVMHWSRGRIAAISQTTLSNAFSLRLRFHCILFPMFELKILQQWVR